MEVGTQVQIIQLETERGRQFNGREGTCIGPHLDGRYKVQLSEKIFSVARKNLIILTDDNVFYLFFCFVFF